MAQTTNERARVAAAKDFSQRWAGRGYEKGDTHSFWLELLRDVVGMADVTTNVRFEQSTSERGYIDVTIPDAKTMIEQKSLGVSLDKPELRQGVMVTPFEQVKRYADSLPNSQRPDTIIVSDFGRFRIHDLDQVKPGENFVEFRLAELPEQLHLLDFLVDPQLARRQREEQVSLDAGALIGKVYDLLRDQYADPDATDSQHSLNVLCVRLVFCLFAEDAGLFPKDAFYNYLHGMPARQVRPAIKDLFAHLRARPEDRDPYASDELKAFPYVNGGLFELEVEVPPFTDEIVQVLLEEVSRGTDWSQISPTIFGGVFESTLNPETRRSGGMHYTSPVNIHRLIDPLFLDTLKAELRGILTEEGIGDRKRRNNLERFHTKLAGLTFFDPACGSGNFLTETYIALRRLENIVLAELARNQTSLVLSEDHSPLRVSLEQFYGIEINDFAVNVARTALWIAKLQANAESQMIITQAIEDLPLTDSANIVHGNALTVDWTGVLDPVRCSYIIGNPPFVGKMTVAQRDELRSVAGKAAGKLDYVAGWFIKAAAYMKDTTVETALVSTNSINQGQQVIPLWQPLLDAGLIINFAHRSFKWVTESKGGASVTVVIIGFGYVDRARKMLWEYPGATVTETEVSHINAYLIERPDEYINMRTRPVSHVPRIVYGFKPADHGYLTPKADMYDEMVAADPAVADFFRRFLGAREFVDGKRRFCLWLDEADLPNLSRHPVAADRVTACAAWRSDQVVTGDAYKLRVVPWSLRPIREFDPAAPYLLVPCHTSGERRYFPMGFIEDGAIPGNSCFFIPHASVYEFGVMTSRMHNIWLDNIGGRLKTDTRYASDLVYNTFVWPKITEEQRGVISALAQAVLDERANLVVSHGLTMAKMYKPGQELIYPALFNAHAALDTAVERAYGLEPGLDEKDIVAHLFRLYNSAMADK